MAMAGRKPKPTALKVLENPTLSRLIKIIPSTKRMVYQPTGSIYQVLSSEVATKHGLNVSACIFDELHGGHSKAVERYRRRNLLWKQ